MRAARPAALAVVVSVCLSALGCFDSLAPDAGQRVQLAFYPVFEGYGPLDGAPSDVDSFRFEINNPPNPPDTIYRHLPPGQDTIQLSVVVRVGGGLDTVGIAFHGFNSTSGTELYAGTQSVELHAGIPAPPQPVQAGYVGPGKGIGSLVVNPRQFAINPGQAAALTYTGFDTLGVAMPDDSVPVHFRSRDNHIAQVDAAGRVLGMADGVVEIIIASVARNTIRDSARVTVTSAPAPLIGLAPTTITFNGVSGGSDPAAQTVAVTNVGGQVLAGLAVGTIAYGTGATDWLSATLGGTTAPATLTLTPQVDSLPAGTYTATVPVTASGVSNSPQSVAVTFVVAPPPAIALAPTAVSFNGVTGGASPAAKTVNVTNGGGGTLSGLAVGTITYGAGATGWLAASLNTTAPSTLTLTPTITGLAVGTYTATVPVTSGVASNSPQTVSVSFVVGAGPAIALAPTTITFNGIATGASPAAQTVSVTNSSGGTLSGLATGAITYGAGATGWLSASFSTSTAPSTLTLTPNITGLAAGTYTASVPVTSGVATNSPQTVSVTFNVAAGPAIALAPATITFNGTVTLANPASQTVSVTNSSGGTLNGLLVGTITYGAGATGWLTARFPDLNADGNFTNDPATAPATLTLTASLAGLSAGTYTATVPVTSPVASNSPRTVAVTFVVAPPPLTAITVAPGFSVLLVDGTVSLSVTGKDAGGAAATVTGLTFVSRTPAVASVNAAGLVTGNTNGTTVIVASAVGSTGTVFDSITVAVAGVGAAVVSAISDGRAFDIVKPGDTVRVLVQVDLRRVAPDKLGSYNAELDWSTAALTYVRSDPVAGGFVAPTLNESATASGQLRFGAANAVGTAGPTVGLVMVVFVANAVGNSPLTFSVTDLSGINPTFTQYVSAAVITASTVRVQ